MALVEKGETFIWPAKSLDLNIIESVWSVMARGLLASSRQFETTDELAKESASVGAIKAKSMFTNFLIQISSVL